jgi:hypothetical protein
MKAKSKRTATSKRAKGDLEVKGKKSRGVKGGIIIIGGVPAVSNVSQYASSLRVNPFR